MILRGLWWFARRLLLPIALATLVGKIAFAVAMSGTLSFADLFVDSEDLIVTAGLIAVVLIFVVGAAYAIRRMGWHPAARLIPLLIVGAGAGWILIYLLTEVEAYASLSIAPSLAATFVWLLCNLDLLKRVHKEPIRG